LSKKDQAGNVLPFDAKVRTRKSSSASGTYMKKAAPDFSGAADR